MFPRFLPAVLAVLFSMTAAQAGPERYRLDTARSHVAFTFDMQGTPTSGTIPIQAADMQIDLDNVPASRVDVTLNARGVRAGMLLVTQTMKGAQILDTARYPAIRFRSVRFTGDLSAATVTGALTIRDITRTITLDAGLYRQRGTEPGTRDRLTVLLTGTISRSAFGAGGFPGFVGDRIDLRILARIENTPPAKNDAGMPNKPM